MSQGVNERALKTGSRPDSRPNPPPLPKRPGPRPPRKNEFGIVGSLALELGDQLNRGRAQRNTMPLALLRMCAGLVPNARVGEFVPSGAHRLTGARAGQHDQSQAIGGRSVMLRERVTQGGNLSRREETLPTFFLVALNALARVA